MLGSTVEYELAKILNNTLYGDDKYAAENVEVTWDNYLGTQEYEEGELIEDGDNIHGKYYMAPLYADVIDYLFSKHIVVEFIPAFTYALYDHVAYYYKVYKINDENARLVTIFEENQEMASLKLAIKIIVKRLIDENYISF